jgi:endogenous inhibitor of DNA gyrase (YacG/DUF329 family)
MRKSHVCPVCHKALGISDRKNARRPLYFPFCSKRCQLIDLGQWLEGGYKIVSPLGGEDGPGSEKEGQD